MKHVVLCLNDYPIGIYVNPKDADEAALADWKKREPQWEQHGLVFKQSFEARIGAYTRWHYHQHEFEIGAEAHL